MYKICASDAFEKNDLLLITLRSRQTRVYHAAAGKSN